MVEVDALGQLLAQMQRASPGNRILILDLPPDAVLRMVACKPAVDRPLAVQLSITVESLDAVAMQGIAQRLAVTAGVSEAVKAANEADHG